MRVAIYARFSSDLQDQRSITDQVTMAKDRAAREGWTVVEVYADAAISGAHLHNRPGMLDLMLGAKAGKFEAVLTESIDRLSRDQGDISNLHKHLAFNRVKIITLADGEVTKLHAGLRGIISSVFLDDLALKTRRGHIGRARAGRVPGSLAYGYDVVLSAEEKGLRKINPEQAAVVLRIFTSYAAGRSPRDIAEELNAQSIPGPRGGPWNASTLIGTHKRRSGILSNPSYAGKIVYNRQRFVKHPENGKRMAQINAPSEWIEVDAPELRIVPEEIVAKVQARRAHLGELGLRRRVRPKHLLSGLVRCGLCGAAMIVVRDDRVGCSNQRNKRTCQNRQTILMAEVEARIVDALNKYLLAPEVVAEAVEVYRRERELLNRQRARDRAAVDRELGEVNRKLASIVRAIEDGVPGSTVRERMAALEERKAILEARLPDAPDENVAVLHPQAAEQYRRIVGRIHQVIGGVYGADQSTAVIEQVRALITQIVAHPDPSCIGRTYSHAPPMRLDLVGNLAALLAEPTGNVGAMKAVAGARNGRRRASDDVPFLVDCPRLSA